MTTHPILGELASVESLGRAVLEAIRSSGRCSIPTILAEINARALELNCDPRAVGSLCAQDPQCYEGPIPCPHHVESDPRKPPMRGRMIEGDFEANTATFEMIGDYYLSAGEFLIVPIARSTATGEAG
jgi:hypothetical protein